MSGFKNSSLNLCLRQGLFEQLCEFVIKCSELMIVNCNITECRIENDEEKISAHLTENYLNNASVRNSITQNTIPFKFLIESKENFDATTNTYIGRVDIKAASFNYFSCKNNNDYYSIECKRIDGKNDLNKKYILQGVARFVVPPIKYQSFHNQNIMLAYVVKKIDIVKNVATINLIHKKELSPYTISDLKFFPCKSSSNLGVCESEYTVNTKPLLLRHIFFDLSSIVQMLHN